MWEFSFPTEAPVCILGYGVNHQELVGFLLHNGVEVVVRDSNTEKEQKLFSDHPDHGAKLRFEHCHDVTSNLTSYKVAFRSPGIPFTSPNLRQAVAEGLILTSQTQLFLELCKAKVVGITGTKGKGTTSTLIYNILSQGLEENVYLAGNIGVDPFSFINDLTVDNVVVLELSSFQLEGLSISPHVAVVLHVAVDHLDHHGSLEAYRAAKRSILSNQHEGDVAIINTQYADMEYYRKSAVARVLQYSASQPGQESAWVDAQAGEEVVFYSLDGKIDSFSITDRKLVGKHNLENILPAVLVGALFHVSPSIMQREVVGFGGLEHRLSVVPTKNGVKAYDDSIATTPESTLVALEAFEGKRIHLVAGGKDKGQEYDSLAQEIAKRCQSLLLLPGARSSDLAAKALAANPDLPVVQATGTHQLGVMRELLFALGDNLQEGDVLLLSPSAASDTPYSNYKERGDAFSYVVREELV
jgi:UDP-N-acetylmuramoylalanine--D-glutamate ligase